MTPLKYQTLIKLGKKVIKLTNVSRYAPKISRLCKNKELLLLEKLICIGGKLKLAVIYFKIYQEKISSWKIQKTIEKEWVNDGHLTTNVEVFNKELVPWIVEYNFVRPYQSLGYLTPMEFAVKYK